MLKHAFIISAHKNVEQLKLLISSLQFGDVFIHIDKKNDQLYNELKSFYSQNDHIYFVSNRISVNWSGFSQVRATIELLKLVNATNNRYDYVHFISGQDLLVMKQNKLDQYLIKNGLDKQYVDVGNIGSYKWRLTTYSFFRENPKNRTIRYRILDNCLRVIQRPIIHRNNFKNNDLYKGSQWFSITSDCMKYILETIDKTDYINKFKYTACPDEHFFQILLMNSKYKNHIMKYNGRYVVFEGLNASPKLLMTDDYDNFMNGNYMFARKFDLSENPEIINKIITYLQT
ncbi:MAG: beta-1,6-N-acetylglucosaminyltransferase [Absicoccus porci]|uniref:beta-1,6-N-acetylglucosaminyltransferase n=1 Tax=Absicoccus porci TaxID=2486576 RepID=UPI0023EF5A39|nr:beta-1,6-N-acetylglucosaminyltransferase [Absicoccus porci]MDD7330133.1 beta-1,6-N-acetylglucosaminyltransferase [Absicoccus porci]MDY4739045.1 beta-1,6-N-acetylglucosaminyltransferase [Absicoccus porci]